VRLLKIIREKARASTVIAQRVKVKTEKEPIINKSPEDVEAKASYHEIKLNLAIGFSPILAQLRREWGNENDKQ